LTDTPPEVVEKDVEPLLVAGVRMRGRYDECGKGFRQIGRKLGRFLAGKPFMLHYDTEYKADDADFEACFPIRERREVDGISIRELPGGHSVSLMHHGPYDTLGDSYDKIRRYVADRGYSVRIPTREIYLKGPGMLFKGNPKRYVTEIQMLLEE